ncbi:hypothetical protein [Solimonas soli]|uniref:hypothetical protein n=1 Tax=Solimonas soli TaxID=413479 RepID=UPI0004B793FC|nr:hypothetical protein [Solimonas soli]
MRIARTDECHPWRDFNARSDHGPAIHGRALAGRNAIQGIPLSPARRKKFLKEHERKRAERAD